MVWNTIGKYIHWDMHTITALPFMSNLSTLTQEVISFALSQKYKIIDPDHDYPYKKGDANSSLLLRLNIHPVKRSQTETIILLPCFQTEAKFTRTVRFC